MIMPRKKQDVLHFTYLFQLILSGASQDKRVLTHFVYNINLCFERNNEFYTKCSPHFRKQSPLV